MTEEEALQIGRKIWHQLSLTGRNCKLSAGEEIGIDVSNFHDYCALCEYACCNIIPGKSICFSCPLKGRWVPGTTNNCIKEGSPFNNWDDCSCKEERKVYAKEIEILHINALARLIAKK